MSNLVPITPIFREHTRVLQGLLSIQAGEVVGLLGAARANPLSYLHWQVSSTLKKAFT